MKYCKDCVGFDECKTTGITVEFAVDDGVCIDFDERKPQTNADRIRAMSDEELAVLFADEIPHGDCYGCDLNCIHMDKGNFEDSCQNAWYGWLQQPADKGE